MTLDSVGHAISLSVERHDELESVQISFARFIEIALQERPCYVCVNELRSYHDWTETFGVAPAFCIDLPERFSVYDLNGIRFETLLALVATGDFHWDAVWIVFKRGFDAPHDIEHVRRTLLGYSNAVGARNEDVPESIIPEGDGDVVTWFRPTLELETVRAKLSDVLRPLGIYWSFVT